MHIIYVYYFIKTPHQKQLNQTECMELGFGQPTTITKLYHHIYCCGCIELLMQCMTLMTLRFYRVINANA